MINNNIITQVTKIVLHFDDRTISFITAICDEIKSKYYNFNITSSSLWSILIYSLKDNHIIHFDYVYEACKHAGIKFEAFQGNLSSIYELKDNNNNIEVYLKVHIPLLNNLMKFLTVGYGLPLSIHNPASIDNNDYCTGYFCIGIFNNSNNINNYHSINEYFSNNIAVFPSVLVEALEIIETTDVVNGSEYDGSSTYVKFEGGKINSRKSIVKLEDDIHYEGFGVDERTSLHSIRSDVTSRTHSTDSNSMVSFNDNRLVLDNDIDDISRGLRDSFISDTSKQSNITSSFPLFVYNDFNRTSIEDSSSLLQGILPKQLSPTLEQNNSIFNLSLNKNSLDRKIHSSSDLTQLTPRENNIYSPDVIPITNGHTNSNTATMLSQHKAQLSKWNESPNPRQRLYSDPVTNYNYNNHNTYAKQQILENVMFTPPRNNHYNQHIATKSATTPPLPPDSYDYSKSYSNSQSNKSTPNGYNNLQYPMSNDPMRRTRHSYAGMQGLSDNNNNGISVCPNCETLVGINQNECHRCRIPLQSSTNVLTQSHSDKYSYVNKKPIQQGTPYPYSGNNSTYTSPQYQSSNQRPDTRVGNKSLSFDYISDVSSNHNNYNHNVSDYHSNNTLDMSFKPEVIVRQGDWICNFCLGHNFATKIACFTCHASRPGFENGITNEQREMLGIGKLGGTSAEAKPGDWTCPKCHENVFAKRNRCYRCTTPKPRKYI